MTKNEVLKTARALSKDERLDLAMELWEGIQLSTDELPLSDEQKAELDRRLSDDRAQPQPAEEWMTLREGLLRGEL